MDHIGCYANCPKVGDNWNAARAYLLTPGSDLWRIDDGEMTAMQQPERDVPHYDLAAPGIF